MRLGRFIARLIIGGLFVGHGTQKLFGWFGGPGLEGTEKMMDNLDMKPPKQQALAASWAETAGGALIVLGAATPLAAALLIGTMITAIRKVHLPNGLWASNQGYEYNLVLIAALAALIDAGPGKPSVDAARGIEASGPAWMLATLAAGAAGSTLAIEIGGLMDGAADDAGEGAPASEPRGTAVPASA
jgi:putative oxidoreductase